MQSPHWRLAQSLGQQAEIGSHNNLAQLDFTYRIHMGIAVFPWANSKV